MGGSYSTQRAPIQTQEEHASSPQRGVIKPRTFWLPCPLLFLAASPVTITRQPAQFRWNSQFLLSRLSLFSSQTRIRLLTFDGDYAGLPETNKGTVNINWDNKIGTLHGCVELFGETCSSANASLPFFFSSQSRFCLQWHFLSIS